MRPANRARGPSGPAEPLIQSVTFFTVRLLQDSTADFRNGQRGDEEVIVLLRPHPSQQRFDGSCFDDIADDVGIKEVARHRSTLRPSSRGRLRSRSAPTRGERRNAARIPPAFGGSPATACRMVRRSCPASGPSSVNFRARAPEQITVSVERLDFKPRDAALCQAGPSRRGNASVAVHSLLIQNGRAARSLSRRLRPDPRP